MTTTEATDATALIQAITAAAADLEALEQQVSESRHKLADIAAEACKLLGIDQTEPD
jgi:hypothetical protein